METSHGNEPRSLDVVGRVPAGEQELLRWVAQAEDSDAQAALAVAREGLIPHRGRRPYLANARAWLDYAIDLGGDDLLWDVAERLVFADEIAVDLEQVRWTSTLWGRGIRNQCREMAPHVRVDPSVLGPIYAPDLRLLTQDWSVALSTPDLERATTALSAAVGRFMRVTETGEELTEDELDANDESLHPVFTPSWVSDPEVKDGVVTTVLDCKDVLSLPMARTVLRITLEEGIAAGLSAAELVQTPYHLPHLALAWDEESESYLVP